MKSQTARSGPPLVIIPCVGARFIGTDLEDWSLMANARRSWWTWNVGKIAGIPIRMHLTLVLLLAWITLSYATSGASVRATGLGVVLVLAIFAIIVVHELAHALVARHYGVATRDIMLLPVGGIASLERMPERPSQELAVALVGPMVNLALAALLLPFRGAFVDELIYINVGLALFNLLPAFPMDGGRALRALLAMSMPAERATDIAASLGRALAVLLAVIGLFYNPMLVLIGVVVWFGASQERALVHLKHAIAGVPVSAAMLRKVAMITPEQPLEDAATLLLGQEQLPVIDRGEPVGVITRGDLATALAHAGPNATVAMAPRHDVVTVAPADPLDLVLDRLREAPDSVAVVVDHGEPVGLLTAEALAAYVAIHERRERAAA
jgi:stage IV sporulation protein FB